MNESQMALARELTAHPQWRWLPGTAFRIDADPPPKWPRGRVVDGWCVAITEEGKPTNAGTPGEGWLTWSCDMTTVTLDLDDPATVGCLMALLWETTANRATVRDVVSPAGTNSPTWDCEALISGLGVYHAYGDSPGEVVARALLTAWRVEP